MKYAILLLPLLSTGCIGDIIKKLASDPPSFHNDSAYPDGLFYKVWGELEEVSQISISDKGLTATVHGDRGNFERACPDASIEIGGCSDPSNINIYGGVGTDFIQVGTATAHQLAHMHFWQRSDGHDPDGSHDHEEWWGEDGYVAQITHLIEEGYIQ